MIRTENVIWFFVDVTALFLTFVIADLYLRNRVHRVMGFWPLRPWERILLSSPQQKAHMQLVREQVQSCADALFASSYLNPGEERSAKKSIDFFNARWDIENSYYPELRGKLPREFEISVAVAETIAADIKCLDTGAPIRTRLFIFPNKF